MPNPDEVKRLHELSDVDNWPLSQHHTLGRRPTQASAGNHTHDGANSEKISAENLLERPPLGVISRVSIAGDSATANSTADVTVMTLPAVTPVSANRLWVVKFYTRSVQSSVAGDVVIGRIKEGVTTLQEGVENCDTANTGADALYIETEPFNPTEVSHIYIVTITRAIGTGIVRYRGAATYPIWARVEDVGINA